MSCVSCLKWGLRRRGTYTVAYWSLKGVGALGRIDRLIEFFLLVLICTETERNAMDLGGEIDLHSPCLMIISDIMIDAVMGTDNPNPWQNRKLRDAHALSRPPSGHLMNENSHKMDTPPKGNCVWSIIWLKSSRYIVETSIDGTATTRGLWAGRRHVCENIKGEWCIWDWSMSPPPWNGGVAVNRNFDS